MVVLSALRSALDGLVRNPVLFVAAGVLVLLQLPQYVAQAAGPLVAAVVSLLFTLVSVLAVPFIQAGLYGMADEALDGRTRLGTFVAAGTGYYVTMFAAYLLVLAAVFVFGLVVFIGAVVFVLAVGVDEAAFSDPTVLAVGGLLAGVALLCYLAVAFFVQFYGQAIVVDDAGVVEGFRRSVGLVRRNLRSTFGYSLLVVVLSLVFGGLSALATMLISPERNDVVALPELSLGGLLVVAVVFVLLLIGYSALFTTYSVAFYRGLSTRRPGAGAGSADD